MRVNISSNSVDQVNDLIAKVNLNSFSDFDLVSENDVDGISNKILFNGKILGDYFESVGNKVLEVDNISNLFNSNQDQKNLAQQLHLVNWIADL